MSVAYTTYYTLKDTDLDNRALPILGWKKYISGLILEVMDSYYFN